MKGMKIKHNSENFQNLQKPIFEKDTHYSILDLDLDVLLYILDAKKGCKKSLNKLSLATDLLKHTVIQFFYLIFVYMGCLDMYV